MDLNKWFSVFMPYLRRFYCNDDMAFIYNEILKKFGIACSNVHILYNDNDKEYFASDFEKCLSNFGLMDLLKTGQGLRFMFMMVFCGLQ